MRKSAKLWFALVLSFATFFVWHQSWTAPLTDAEVQTAVERMGVVNVSGDLNQAAIIDFFLSDDGRPFYMINLNKFQEGVLNPDLDNPDEVAAFDANRRYGLHMLPRLLWRASYPVLSVPRISTISDSFETGLVEFDYLTVVRYRSRRDFLAIIETESFHHAVGDKFFSLEAFAASPSEIRPSFSLPVIVGGFHVLVGALGQFWIGR